MSLADDLERLHKIHQEGGLSDEEFARAKEKLLERPTEPPPLRRERENNSLGDAANRYVSFQIGMSIIGVIIFLIFLFAVILPKTSSHPRFVPSSFPIQTR